MTSTTRYVIDLPSPPIERNIPVSRWRERAVVMVNDSTPPNYTALIAPLPPDSTPMVSSSERLSLVKTFRDVFEKAAKERKKRQDYVQDPCETRFSWTVPAWVLFERAALHAAVNAERARRGLPSVDITAIDRVERLACGHVDYGTKYPLYCAEIALGENEPRA